MAIVSEIVTGLAKPLFSLVDDLFTSDDERAAAKLKILKLDQEGKLQTMKTQMSAIMAEAQSSDKWTSRARPGFLYVIYIYILAAIPMGFLMAFNPDIAANVTFGVGEWLKVIPESMWGLFGVGYLGYAGVRSWDKKTGKVK